MCTLLVLRDKISPQGKPKWTFVFHVFHQWQWLLYRLELHKVQDSTEKELQNSNLLVWVRPPVLKVYIPEMAPLKPADQIH